MKMFESKNCPLCDGEPTFMILYGGHLYCDAKSNIIVNDKGVFYCKNCGFGGNRPGLALIEEMAVHEWDQLVESVKVTLMKN